MGFYCFFIFFALDTDS